MGRLAERRGRRAAWTVLIGVLAALGPGAAAAGAAPPTVGAVWASSVQPTTALLRAEVDPNGLASSYHVDYIAAAAYDANVAAGKDGFAGAARSPAGSDAAIPGTSPTVVSPLLFGLAPNTAYRYRLVVRNSDGNGAPGPTQLVVTPLNGTFVPADGRGWELVSPVEKNGGQVDPPGSLAGGGVLQAAADGQSVTYSSDASFADGAQGAPRGSQYFSTRQGGGWSTSNITPSLLAGSYGAGPDGVPFQLFSGDLARGLLLNGRPCRGEATGCPVANPPLAGTDAPAGYQNYYLRESASSSYRALLGSANAGFLVLEPAAFELSFAGASPDLGQIVLSTCAALTATATEVPLGAGCDPAHPNLYKWSPGAGLSLINPPAAEPRAALGAQAGAVSVEGSRIYWADEGTGSIYLREGSQTHPVGEGTFQTATPDGATAFYIDPANHLQSYDAGTHLSTDLTPSGGVVGMLGASGDGEYVYYATGAGVFLWHSGATVQVAAAADVDNYPPSTGTARVSADGTKLVFVSTTSLTSYDNIELSTGVPTRQVYLYDAAGAGSLTCVSCNPTRARPLGPSAIPGARANGQGPDATASYKPRVLSADGRHVFFDSRDALVFSDVNLDSDVYRWQAPGSGSCTRPAGCVALVSSGLAGGATFVDASTDGSDAFFLTSRSLVGTDPGGLDLYDARIGGGFPEPGDPPLCIGDACQTVPPAPEDPTLTTVLPGPGNPAERYYPSGRARQCPKGKTLTTVRKNGAKVKKCVKKKDIGRRGGGNR